MKKSNLYRKIVELEGTKFTPEEVKFLASNIINFNLGLKLNFTELDNEISTKYFVLKEELSKSINPSLELANNLIIGGENLYGLQALKCAGQKVDLIYIDPPYNTGKEFIYTDNYGTKKIVNADDPHKHSKWLSFMKRRLVLAKTLLKDTGYLLVSIDDNEQAYLKVLMDEVFGEENFLNQLVWVSNKKGRQIANSPFVKCYEYILVYSRKPLENCEKIVIERAWAQKIMPCIYETKKQVYKVDNIGKYFFQNKLHNSNISAFNSKTRKHLFYPIYTDGHTISLTNKPNFVKILPPTSKTGLQAVWRWSKEKLKKEYYDIEIVPCGNTFNFYTKIRTDVYRPKDLILASTMTTKSGTSDLDSLDMKGEFPFPKPVSLIKFLIATLAPHNSTVLDFFAGSGTTAQAIMELNFEKDSKIRFIMITDDKVNHKSNYKYSGKDVALKRLSKSAIKTNSSFLHLSLELVDSIDGDYEQIDSKKSLYNREFNKNISVLDFNLF